VSPGRTSDPVSIPANTLHCGGPTVVVVPLLVVVVDAPEEWG